MAHTRVKPADPSPLALGDVSIDLSPPKPYVPPTPAQRTSESFAARKGKTPREKVESTRVEAKREYTRPLLLFGNPKDPECVELFRLFNERGVNKGRAEAFAEALPTDALIGAIDSRGGKVVIHGWKTPLTITPEDAARTLEPYVGALLYTHVDTEGMMTGLDFDAVKSVNESSRLRLIAAGGIRTREEIDALDALGIDAVVGMAIYTGAIELKP